MGIGGPGYHLLVLVAQVFKPRGWTWVLTQFPFLHSLSPALWPNLQSFLVQQEWRHSAPPCLLGGPVPTSRPRVLGI